MLIDNVYNTPLKEEYDFINKLPPTFRNQVLNSIKHLYIERINFFEKGDSNFFNEIYKKLYQRKCTFIEDIYCQYDQTKSIYFVLSGSVSL